jgi:hypothetical protein
MTKAAVSWPNHPATRKRAKRNPTTATKPMICAACRPGSAEKTNGRSATVKPSDRRCAAQYSRAS